MKTVIGSVLIGLGLLSGNLILAQDTAMPIDGGTGLTASNIDWTSAPDWQVALQAIEKMPPMPAINATNGNTFYSAQHAEGTAEPWPPLPGNIWNQPAWDLNDGQYLLDDLNFRYGARRHNAVSQPVMNADGTMTLAMISEDEPVPPGDGSTNDYGSAGLLVGLTPDYGTNLYIAQVSQSGGNYSGIMSNTIFGVQYELQYTYALQVTNNWLSADWFFPGSEVTNWTSFSVPTTSPSNMFFRVRSWESDDGSGLPLWWEEEYLSTNSVDPNAQDSAGDGWTIYQKYEMGIPPGAFTTPPMPQGMVSSYDPSNDLVSVDWLASPGPVTSYTVNIGGNNYSVSADSTSFQNNISDDDAFYDPVDFGPNTYFGNVTVKANYAGGDSSSASAPLQALAASLPDYLAPGQQGQAYLTLASLPSDTVAVQVTRLDYYAEQFEGDSSFDTNFDIPVSSFTNGVAAFPAQWLGANPVDGYGASEYEWWIQTLDSHGNLSAATYLSGSGYTENADPTYNDYSVTSATWPTEPWFDGREQLKQNLAFLLRAGLNGAQFQFTEFYTNSDIPITFAYPTNYAQASYYDFGPQSTVGVMHPFGENYLYRNFAFDLSDMDTNGVISCFDYPYYNSAEEYGLAMVPPFGFTFQPPSTSGTAITPILSSAQSQWLFTYRADGIGWQTVALNQFGTPYIYQMETDVSNSFGLEFLSTESAWGNTSSDTQTFYPGDILTNGEFYSQTAQPELQTVEYDFWNPNAGYYDSGNWIALQPLPGMAGFSPTNQSQLQLAGVGQQGVRVAGYAKEELLNGYPGVYGYLGQYFTNAYEIDTNGNVTTNQTGIVSPYGDFFATQPGPAALVTMPDPDTGAQGTCTVYCVSLALDANHDGNMDLNFGGTDATSSIKPMEFWVNSGYSGVEGNVEVTGGILPDYSYDNIVSQRDLENFARLWICGVPVLTNSYQVTLSWANVTGNPSINLYDSVETNGGTSYLTDTNIAAVQSSFTYTSGSPYSYKATGSSVAIAQLTNGSSFIFPAAYFTNSGNKYFLFEGSGIGSGELVMTITDGSGNTVAQTGVWLDLHSVDDFFERAVITDNTTGAISNWTSTLASVAQATASATGNDTNIIIMVHGINVGNWDWLNDSETVFKRLYWAGYKGQFSTVKWPCNYLTPPQPLTLNVFNLSEAKGYKASTAFTTYLNQLRSRSPPGCRLDIFAHSQGNTVAGEAVKNGAPCDTYILTQAALPDGAYDINATNYPNFIAQEDGDDITPEWQPMGYQGVYTNLTGKIVNFYNPNDPVLDVWNLDQEYDKPSGGYYYDGTNCLYVKDGIFIGTNVVTDFQETRAMVSRARSLSLGQSGPESAHGVIRAAVDLHANYGFDNAFPADHSAQWTWPIQTTLPYYNQMLVQISSVP